MSLDVDVVNETDLPLEEEAIRQLARAVLVAEAATAGLVVAFVSEEAVAALNERYRAKPEPTDVLSFPYHVPGEEDDWPEPDAGEEDGLGDVVVCPAVAARYAGEDGTALAEELGRLVVHGVLHLLSYDHEVDDGEMLARQKQLLIELAPLIPAILPQD